MKYLRALSWDSLLEWLYFIWYILKTLEVYPRDEYDQTIHKTYRKINMAPAFRMLVMRLLDQKLIRK